MRAEPDEGIPRQQLVQAGLVIRSIEHVRWPEEEAGTALVICTLGDLSFERALALLKGREVRGRKVAVRRVSRDSTYRHCAALVVGASEQPYQEKVLAAVASHPVLTFGESKDFAESGGILELRPGVHRIAYELNLIAAKAAGLTVDPILASSAARIVETREPPGQ